MKRNDPKQLLSSLGITEESNDRPVVCIQGLGFVGAAMAAAVAQAKGPGGESCFTVVGVDLPEVNGDKRVAAINAGKFPFNTTDKKLIRAIESAHQQGNLAATTDPAVYGLADIVVVDIHLDLQGDECESHVDFSGFQDAIKILAETMKPGALILVETTVPPGTCANIAAPILSAGLIKRGLPDDAVLLAHSYERVMPGPEYLDSIINFWRVYSGHTETAADTCESFFNKIINVEKFPLKRLPSTTASETAKVMENSYRAVNIAFAGEWGRFGEAVGIDMFEVIDSIRVRPTHNNLRQPGFGVGGYCLTKDPLFSKVAARQIFNQDNVCFPFCDLGIKINREMPIRNLHRLSSLLGGNLDQQNILLLGVAYRPEVDDTRYAPAEAFVRTARKEGARVRCHDPYVRDWPEMEMVLDADLPSPDGFDAIVFAVPHKPYRELNVVEWLGKATPLIYDADNVLGDEMRKALRTARVRVESAGRGAGL